jgi:glycosyltransferase involved in cell wall biosynthesis
VACYDLSLTVGATTFAVTVVDEDTHAVTRRIRVLTVIDSLGVGGAEALLPVFLQQVDRDRFDVHVLTLGTVPDNHLQRAVRDSGSETVSWHRRRLLSAARIDVLTRRMRESRVDLVHTHLLYSNVQGAAAAWRAGIPCVATLHNLYPSRRRASSVIKRAIEISVLRSTKTSVIAVTSEVAQAYSGQLFGLTSSRVTTIPNAIDLDRIERVLPSEAAETRADVLRGAAGPLLVSVGRIAPQKGFVDLVRAAEVLLPQYPEMRIVIAGRVGAAGPQVKQEIARLGLEDSVVLLGERDDVPRLMRAADAFVLPSHWEGGPIVLLEAMAAGTPIVATRVGGIPEVIRDGENGVLVPPGQPELLARGIDTVLRDPLRASHMLEAARIDVQSYRADAWARRIERLYDALLAERRSRDSA